MNRIAVLAAAIAIVVACPRAEATSYSIPCSACTGQVSKFYAQNKAKSEDPPQTLQRLSGCFDQRASSQFSNILLSAQELRNAFEATGQVFNIHTLNQNLDAIRTESAYLEQAVSSGYWKASWPVGATDCETHAKNLKAYLDDLFKRQNVSGDYSVEVVNSYPNIRATDATANPLPGSNHYIVRIVSLRTGRSYLGDVYTGTHFSREDQSDRIVFNDYEACFFDQVTLKRYGQKMSDGSWKAIAAAFTPVLRTRLAQEAKFAANQCIHGGSEARFSDQ